MSKIKLVNENGKIVARDVDTGDIVPIEFGSDALAQNLDLQYSYDIQNAKAVDAQSVSADRLNADHRPAPGELQSVLQNDVAADEVVVLHSGKEYDPGSETTVPRDVTLRGNGAVFKPSSDYDVLFIDTGATAEEIIVDWANVTASSRAVRLSSSDATNGYKTNSPGDRAKVDCVVFGNNDTETALEVKDDGTGLYNCQLNVVAENCNVGIQLQITSAKGFINGCRGEVRISNCGTGIYHTGVTEACKNTFYGVIEPSGTHSEYGIRNDAGAAPSVTLVGHIYDPGTFNTNAIAGEEIHLLETTSGGPGPDTMDGSAGQFVRTFSDAGNMKLLTGTNQGYQVTETSSGNNQTIRSVVDDIGGSAAYKILDGNGSNIFQVRNDGFTDLRGNKLRADGPDSILFTQDAYGWDEFQRSSDPSSSDLPSGGACLYISDGSSGVSGSGGDLIWATNDGGTVKTVVLAQQSNAT